jgi:hypothetical protein
MLLPQFTLRTALKLLTACAVLFLFVGIAYRGEAWAWGVSIGMLSLAVVALVQAAFYGIVWCFSRLMPARATRSNSADRSPANAEAAQ